MGGCWEQRVLQPLDLGLRCLGRAVVPSLPWCRVPHRAHSSCPCRTTYLKEPEAAGLGKCWDTDLGRICHFLGKGSALPNFCVFTLKGVTTSGILSKAQRTHNTSQLPGPMQLSWWSQKLTHQSSENPSESPNLSADGLRKEVPALLSICRTLFRVWARACGFHSQISWITAFSGKDEIATNSSCMPPNVTRTVPVYHQTSLRRISHDPSQMDILSRGS